MYPLFETIRLEDGIVQNLEWHQKRYEFSYFAYYGEKPSPAVQSLLRPSQLIVPPAFKKGTVKLKISYNQNDKSLQFSPYKIKEIDFLKIVEVDRIDYSLKYSDRRNLDKIFYERSEADDVLIVQNGWVTDTFYCNIIFVENLNSHRWVTPSTPLLAGTCRARLIATGKIIPQRIRVNDLSRFSGFKLINAMRNFDLLETQEIKRIIK